jgi:hypothetical protein
MNGFKRLALALLFVIAPYAAVGQEQCTDPMQFMLLSATDVLADGMICAGSAEDLAGFLRISGLAGRGPDATLFLRSSGGSVREAMRMGRLIRRHRMSTEVTGTCSGACAFVAAGGVRRFAGPAARVGVDRLWERNSRGEVPTSAFEVSAYLEEMGVNRSLQTDQSDLDRAGTRFLRREDLVRYRLVGDASSAPEPMAPSSLTMPPPQGGPLITVASAHWSLNGSVLSLVVAGDSYRFYYDEPRPELRSVGVGRGTLFMTGRRDGNRFSGQAHAFSRLCGSLPYDVSGEFDSAGAIRVYGAAPLVRGADPSCRVATREPRTIELTPRQ